MEKYLVRIELVDGTEDAWEVKDFNLNERGHILLRITDEGESAYYPAHAYKYVHFGKPGGSSE